MKKTLKKIIPSFIFSLYYRGLAFLGSLIFNFPSKKMVVIGVTGTKGKTSTINFIWSCLMAGGYKTGIISTANIRIGERETLNKYHMTMPGRFTLQKLMAEMVKDGCTHCLIETTSEGIKQYRNAGIQYDIAVFTNLFPEHLQSHGGSFELYKQTKSKIFKNLSLHKKILNGKGIDQIIIANKDNEHADYFLGFNADKKISFAVHSAADVTAHDIITTDSGVRFGVGNEFFDLKISGEFNVYNALPAIIIARQFKIDDSSIRKGLLNLLTIPGRMEVIDVGQNFKVLVDYAHEKESMTNLLKAAHSMKKEGSARIIILLGAEGGGRDKAKRPLMGEISAKMADYVIVSNVDPYEDDPNEILEDIATASEKFGKIREKNLFVIEDRKSGIDKALSLAQKNDIVLITGKGSEQSMIIGGEAIPWDDRKIVRDAILKVLN